MGLSKTFQRWSAHHVRVAYRSRGLFDTTRHFCNYFITGSARLDIYRRGADSMVRRFHPWRLHPFCLAESPLQISVEETFHRLLKFGGFPEPFLEGDPVFAQRWRRVRRETLMREDIRDLESVRDLSAIPGNFEDPYIERL